MRLDRKDLSAVALAVLNVGVLLTTYEGWGVPLVGDSHRWAAAVILLVGLAAGAFSSPGSDPRSYVLAVLVLAAFLFAVLALATASLTALVLLVVAIVALVATSTAHHLRHGRGRPVAA
jgi:hypothetical protein